MRMRYQENPATVVVMMAGTLSHITFEIRKTTVPFKSTLVWDVTSCSLVEHPGYCRANLRSNWVSFMFSANESAHVTLFMNIGYGTDDRGTGIRVPIGSRIFSFPNRPDRLWGSTQSPIQWVPGALSSGVKRAGPEADNSPPVSAKVKKMWMDLYIHSPYASMA
jgi:hypothetical protein